MKNIKKIFEAASSLLLKYGGIVDFPRKNVKQTHRENVPASNCEECFKLNLYVHFLDNVRK